MARVCLALFMICLISRQTLADGELDVPFKLIESVIGWGTKIYENTDQPKKNIELIMRQVEEVSSELDALEARLGINFETMLHNLFVDIEVGSSLYKLTHRLRHGFVKVDEYFDKSLNYKFRNTFGNETLQAFAHKALRGGNSVTHLLDDMHEAFFPNNTSDSGFPSVFYQHSLLNLQQHCDTYVSAQQKIYYIYIHLIITEIKGLLTQQHCLNIEHLFHSISSTYVDEINRAKNKFETRLRTYHELLVGLISQHPQHIRRCEVDSPQRGVHFLELQNFSRITFLDSRTVVNKRCHICPSQSKLREISLRTNTTIYHCKKMGTNVKACLDAPDSHRKYIGWVDGDGKQYGPDTPCAIPKYIHGGIRHDPEHEPYVQNLYQCQVCACSTDVNKTQTDNDNSTIWRISVTEQLSDIFNNKVVTGIRFVIYNNALHLQIKEAQFSHNGLIYNNSGWKDLDVGYTRGRKGVLDLRYEPLRQDRKSLYLDDIKVPDGYAVTGMRFQLVQDSAFRLQILATQFNLETGKLFPELNFWRSTSTAPLRPNDYKRKRMEIDMDKSNGPIRSSMVKYDLESNKFIKFTHTDIHKDAGQTTIPLFDALSVETQPPFPLSGIGLSFRKVEFFGGYITPRIYTLDTMKRMKLPKINWLTNATVNLEVSTTPQSIDDHQQVPAEIRVRPSSPATHVQPKVIQL